MEKKRKRTIPTYREWYEAHREQFERTERHYRELMARLDQEIAEKRAARGQDAA